jgi:CubicO group peptidase (beta-lactamase class C family)
MIDALLESATGRRFTAAVARVHRGGVLQYERAFGVTRNDEHARPVYVDSRFDLASLTKLFVSTLALGAVSRDEIGLDESLAALVEPWRDDERAAITLRMLLSHTSGMASGADYRTLFDEDVASFACERPLRAAPGAQVIYSDLGMIALGVVLERLHGSSLSAQIGTFGRDTLSFRPDERERLWIPATEDDGWRGRVQGIVHEE